MPIVQCPKCARRYDPGKDLDDLPNHTTIKVVCPVCGQWVRLPAAIPVPTPELPPDIVKVMASQSRLVDDAGNPLPREEPIDEAPSAPLLREEPESEPPPPLPSERKPWWKFW
jgi:hypothetical protein